MANADLTEEIRAAIFKKVVPRVAAKKADKTE